MAAELTQGVLSLRLGVLSVLVGTCLVLCSVSVQADGHGRTIHLDSIVNRMDLKPLVPILKKELVNMMESFPSGRLKQVTVVGLIKAPPDKVWQVITDYSRYLEFMPNLQGLRVVSQTGQDVIIAYELEVPGPNINYTLLHRHMPKHRLDISLYGDQGDISSGAWRWDLVPCQEGTQTILVYTLYTDVSEASWLIRQMLKSQPTLEHSLNVATGMTTIQAVKKQAEGGIGREQDQHPDS